LGREDDVGDDFAYQIAEWLERYEVNYRGHEAKPGDDLQVGPLRFIRLKVHGHRQGAGFRQMRKRAGKRAYETFGMFCKFLEIAGNQSRDNRGYLLNERDQPATVEDLAFILDTEQSRVEAALAVLVDVGWIIPPRTPLNLTKHNITKHKDPEISGKFRKSPEPLDVLTNEELPKCLQTEAFKAAWSEWCEYRKERKLPLTPTTVKSQLKKLEKWGHDGAVASIQESISNGWQGLFPSKNGEKPRGEGPDTEHWRKVRERMGLQND